MHTLSNNEVTECCLLPFAGDLFSEYRGLYSADCDKPVNFI
ncbi:hypothetical protein LP43_1011 [Methylophaga thiooxydans]|uniref:Uncharacterized protein n=1 Tax=Methylophaga thiooxydans TaxID=392484 RepID=A0A0A0BHP9_9GAMM|nr:hypothetical protein LP43_1011 [Methylophaga thiooxydans]